VQTLISAIDERVPAPPAEQYDLPGQRVCSTTGPDGQDDGGYDSAFEQAISSLPDRFEQVRPLTDVPSGTDLPNLSERKGIDSLEDECRFNAGKLRKIRHLAEDYSHWRSVRGDGNCFYRTVIFGALEALLANKDTLGLERIIKAFEQVQYDLAEEQRPHEQMLRRMRSWTTSTQVEQWVARDGSLDRALIRGCRRLVRMFLTGRAKQESPSGMTYEEVVMALDGSYAGIEDFCEHVVDPMGRDAETLALDALPRQLGIGLRLWLLDRRDEVDLVSLDTPAQDGSVHVHALFKPGHYDLLYLRAPTCSKPPVAEGDGSEESAEKSDTPSGSADDRPLDSEETASSEPPPRLLGPQPEMKLLASGL